MDAARPESAPVPRVALLALGGIGGSSSAAAEVALALAEAGGAPVLFGARPVPRLSALPGEACAPQPGPGWVEALPGPALAAALEREHRVRPFDLVHVHFAGAHLPIALAFARHAGLPVALTLHGSDVAADSRRGALTALAARCAAVAVPSEWLRVQCKEEVEEAQVIPNFLDCARWVDDVPRGESRQVPGTPNLLFVGHLEPWKGLDVLLSALELLPEPRPSLRVHGDGSLAAPLAARAPRGVRFLGPVPLGPKDLHAADLVVVPSRRESFGMVALEALAAGCPLLASAVGGLVDLVGPAGRLVPPGDPRGLADAIQDTFADPKSTRALADRARALADMGRSRARERYDRALGLERHLAFYAGLL